MSKTLWMPEIFASGMVVQRNGFVVWGQSEPWAAVTVQWDGEAYQAAADGDGGWELSLPGAAAGGPYTLSVFSGGASLKFTDVWAGEVWLASGQSNMELRLRETDDSPKAARLADGVHVRYFSQKAYMAPNPQISTRDGQWMRLSNENAYDVSAIGYYVGVELSRALQMPVGILYAAFGGRDIECFLNADSLALCGRTEFRPGQPPSEVYNAMLYPLRRFAIRGVLWYQGENNGDAHPEWYENMFETLIAQFRADWRQIELPFLFVQLPRYGISGTRYNWCVIREAQDNIWRRVPHTGMAVSIDTGERDYVHPSEKRVVSGRLAELCKAMVYGLPAAWRYPRYCGCRTEGKVMVLSVEHAPLCPAPHAAGVEICGQDGVFYPADARATENSIIASAPQVPYPVAVRYAWDNYPQTSIYSQEGLPLAPFRTDSLPIETVHAASTEVPRVPADEIRDTMENWEHVWQREGVWSFHVDTTGAYGKSERRVRKWTEAEQWLLYRIANPVKSISVRYLTRRSYDGEIQLYVSADGERWSNAVTQIVGGRPVADGWNCYTVSAAQIPKGAYYVKVAVAATPAGEDCHDPMIEQIEIV